MKTKLLIIVGMVVFALNSADAVYGLSEDVDPVIDNIDENNLQTPMTVTITNETEVLKESPTTLYEKTCPENMDWPEAPNRCDRRENYTRTELKDLYDEYYQYKGAEWMEMKKTEMDSVISKSSWLGEYPTLWTWLGHAQREIPFENINVYLYYFLHGQAPDVGWGWYAVNDEFEPIVTWYYVSPGAIMMISSIVIIGTITGMILGLKEIGLHPKRKIFAVTGFVLVFVGAAMYSVGFFEFTQSQIDQIGKERFSPAILHTMSIFLGIPIALAGIPVILHGIMQRFSITRTLLASLGLVISWAMFVVSRFD